MTRSSFRGVRVLVKDLAAATRVFEIITGGAAVHSSMQGFDETRLSFGGAHVRLSDEQSLSRLDPLPTRRSGIWAIDLEARDPQASLDASADIGLSAHRQGSGGFVDLTGLRVFISPSLRGEDGDDGEVRLDHLAVLVHDLEPPTLLWEKLSGLSAQRMGLHPISRGAFSANRLMLGERMIELVAPEAGRLSGVTERLAKAGEGPSGLALPARNLQATLERLKTAQIDVVYREPHWIVKPGNASGVSIQLTPRVNH